MTEPGKSVGSSAGSVADFYDADPRRRESDEIEYGDGWTRQDDQKATFRVSYVVDTGEVYSVREPHPGGILARYLDQLGVDQAAVDELTVDVLATVPADAVERALSGWPDAMVGQDSLKWVFTRLADAAR